MAFFKHKIVLWPKKEASDVFIDQKDNNFFSFNLDLWSDRTDLELQPMLEFFKGQSNRLSCLVPDDVTVTKSFIYDTKTETIDKKEIKALAENTIPFDMDTDYIDFQLDNSLADKTIIRAKITNPAKIKILQANLAKIGLIIEQYETVSQQITRVINSFYQQDYFLIYPLNTTESMLILARGNDVFLTSKLKGVTPDIQKIINYSPLYFGKLTNKLFVPHDILYQVKSTTKMESTMYQPSQIAQSLNMPVNYPLPIIGSLMTGGSSPPKTVIMNNTPLVQKPTMQPKKNIIPVILVFVITAAIASLVLWMVTKKNSAPVVENPTSDTITTQPTEPPVPTDTPVPTLAPVSKKLKIEVLNATSINGQAAKVKKELTDLGFTSVTIGNSTEKATQNELRLKATSSDAAPYFQQNLPMFDNATVSSLSSTSTYDIVVVIGTDLSTTGSAPSATDTSTVVPTKKVTPTPTKKLTPSPTPTTNQ